MHKSVQSLLNWTKVRGHMTVLIETLLNNSKIHSVCFLWSLNCKLLGLSAFLCAEMSCQRWTSHSPVVFILSVFKNTLQGQWRWRHSYLPISPLSLSHLPRGLRLPGGHLSGGILNRFIQSESRITVLSGELRLSRVWSPLVPLSVYPVRGGFVLTFSVWFAMWNQIKGHCSICSDLFMIMQKRHNWKNICEKELHLIVLSVLLQCASNVKSI